MKQAAPDKASELAAIPLLLERLGAEDGLKGALVSIDAIVPNAAIAQAITAQGADYLLAVKANQPTLRAEVEAAFAEAGQGLETHVALDKGHGRIEQRRMSVLLETDWLAGDRRFPGELRLPGVACLLRAETCVESRGAPRAETRYFVSSRTRSRPYRKNDQAHVEQKNGAVVRRMVGYRRYEGAAAARELARLYRAPCGCL